METKEYLTEVLTRTEKLLSDLFTSGFLSAHESTLEEMDKMSGICMQCGLIFAGEKLNVLSQEIKINRHLMSQDLNRAVKEFCCLDQYILLCKRKLALDMVTTH